MKKQHLPPSFSLSLLCNLFQFSYPFLFLVEILALEGRALRGRTAPRGGANMFQNGIKAIEEVLEVATYSPKHSLIFFKAKAKELLSKMFSKLTEWYSLEREGLQNTNVIDCNHLVTQNIITINSGTMKPACTQT